MKALAIAVCPLTHAPPANLTQDGLTEIAGLDIDGQIWAIDCNQLKLTIERFYQLTGSYNSFEIVLCLKTYEIHTYKQNLRFLAASRFAGIATGVFHCNNYVCCACERSMCEVDVTHYEWQESPNTKLITT